MFYYLHLTRPPPEQANPSQPLFITPNIANDLRTEYPSPGPNGIDIFYSWVKCAEAAPAPGVERRGLGPMMQPQKLTTWMGNSYKKVQVFPPKEALQVPGGRWQLLLCTRSSESSLRQNAYVTSVDLSVENFGAHVLPILSAPVQFVAGPRNPKGRSGEAGKKQVRNERIFKLPAPLWGIASVGPLRVTEHLSYDLDKKVWDSGVGLSHWLVSTVASASRPGLDWDTEVDIPPIVKNLVKSKEATILELGAGTGLVSIVLATLLSSCPYNPRSNIIATDLHSAMEILETNLSDNANHYLSVQAKSAVLDWDDGKLPQEIQDGVDFIIMADVTYNTASFPSLIQTLSRLASLRRNSSSVPSVLLAYKERDPDERRLWDMAHEIGLHLDEVGRIPGAGGMPIEIYAGTFERSG